MICKICQSLGIFLLVVGASVFFRSHFLVKKKSPFQKQVVLGWYAFTHLGRLKIVSIWWFACWWLSLFNDSIWIANLHHQPHQRLKPLMKVVSWRRASFGGLSQIWDWFGVKDCVCRSITRLTYGKHAMSHCGLDRVVCKTNIMAFPTAPWSKATPPPETLV